MVALCAWAFPVPALADSAKTNEKRDLPVVVTHLIQEDSDGIWYDEADFAQGQDIPFCVVSTLPDNIATRGACPYWQVVRTDAAFEMQDGSIRVELNHADGTSRDVTSRLQVDFSQGVITAGAADINSAVPGLKPDDTFTLYYTMRFADTYRYGFGSGNSNYAYLRYDGDSSASDEAAAGQPQLRTASFGLPFLGVQKAYAAEPGPDPALESSPEVKVTAYTYCIDLVKRAEGYDKLLAGASFCVRDADGLWYVRGESWAGGQGDATVFTTDADGHVLVKGLDADAYDLVEVEAPRHYLPLRPVDVLIESDVAGQHDSMRVTSRTATVQKASAADGTVSVAIDDPIDPEDPDEELVSPGGGPGGKGGGAGSGGADGSDSPDQGLNGLLAKMGDSLPVVALAVLAVLAAVLAATAYRRRSRNNVY